MEEEEEGEGKRMTCLVSGFVSRLPRVARSPSSIPLLAVRAPVLHEFIFVLRRRSSSSALPSCSSPRSPLSPF
jgi:hypothetical protein